MRIRLPGALNPFFRALIRYPINLWLALFGLTMGMLVVARSLFLILNFGQFRGAPLAELILAFVTGFRFDVATALLTISLPALPLFIPSPASIRRIASRVSFSASIICLNAAALTLWGDLLFYSEASRHLTLEPLSILTDWSSMYRMLLGGFLPAFGLFLLAAISLIWLARKIFRNSAEIELSLPGWEWRRSAGLAIIALITLIGIRGGFQKEPLKSADAVIGLNPFVGNIAMNGWYSFLTEATKSRRNAEWMPAGEAFEITRRLVAREDDRFVTGKGDLNGRDAYPILRRSPATGSIIAPGERLNVVTIIVESLNAAYLQSFGGVESVMPFLDSLAGESAIFTNMQAVGTRSFRGLCALLASYPNLHSDSYRLTFLLPRLGGIASILEREGYSSSFTHGAPINSMGVTAIARMSGYREFLSLEDFPESADNGSWGVWDHLALERLHQDILTANEPFNYALFTLCTHAPWDLPPGYRPRFPADHPKSEILNTYSYLDEALQSFFLKESRQPHFNRTLYIIVGDHTTHASEQERFRIGAMFYAPGRLSSRVDDRLCSQLDLLPSILDLLGVEREHSSFGSSLFSNPPGKKWAASVQGSLLNWREGDRLLTSTLDRVTGLFDPYESSPVPKDFSFEEKNVAERLNQSLRAVYQTAEGLAASNRIVPPPH